MNPTLFSKSPHRLIKDVQFAVGVMVAVGGAGVIVANIVQYFS